MSCVTVLCVQGILILSLEFYTFHILNFYIYLFAFSLDLQGSVCNDTTLLSHDSKLRLRYQVIPQ